MSAEAAGDGDRGAGRPDLVAALRLEPLGEGRFRAGNVSAGLGGVVFGGQLLGQAIVAGATVDPDKAVKTVHTVFARGAAPDQPLDIDVDVVHRGRALASASVTIRQGERICTRSTVLLSADEPDLIRHAAPAPEVGVPEDATPSSHGGSWWEIRTVGGVDVGDPDAVGPAELAVWTRFPGAPSSGVESQAVLAYATDGFLIGTAMRPHPGVGQKLAHVTISTSVLSHTLTFHEPVDATRWHLLAHESPSAGHGRAYGRAHVFDEDGRLVASFVQDAMIREFPEGQRPAAGGRSHA